MTQTNSDHSPIELEIFKHLFASIAEEMGERLRRSAYSPNVKERLDFSCALFDAAGEMIAQAAHIPVHLGSTPLSVRAVLQSFDPTEMKPGQIFILNDPFAGGTHLPDITVVAPFVPEGEDRPLFFVANRAHHADIGGTTPGSMPISTHIDEEGLRIPPTLLTEFTIDRICSHTRTPEERRGDLLAQTAALHVGLERLEQLCTRYTTGTVQKHARALQDYTERLVRQEIRLIPNGTFEWTDYLDDDGHGTLDISIHCRLSVRDDEVEVDFSESGDQVKGPVNAVRAIALSAVNYAFRCLMPSGIPSNSGVMRPITVRTRPGSIVDALPPSAVAGGNVETSQRIVDVLFGALSRTLPDRIPAASSGTMNNITIGGTDPRTNEPFAYYETLAGGAGASPEQDGGSGIHTHMTNTLNTPVEALEHAYPFRIESYRIREYSGGRGRYSGGEGLVRCYAFDHPAQVTLLTERRRLQPYGLRGGLAGASGSNVLIKQRERIDVPAKCSIQVRAGQRVEIATPGGGGWGPPAQPNSSDDR